jgi:ABC-2 type transport system permease protein
LRTLFIQRPGRLRVFAAKLLALAVALVPFVLVVFAVGALASSAIALREGADIALPSAWLVVRGLAAGWLILAVWTALGVLLAVFSRGTALAVGIGILYALVIEGLLSALASQVSVVDRLVEFFLRANAYSLVTKLGVSADDVANNGPGSFSGPFVGGGQALLVLGAYVAAFLLVSGWLLRRRDVA